jgi:LmbE family N-acetylglucosaminyl deacetylase
VKEAERTPVLALVALVVGLVGTPARAQDVAEDIAQDLGKDAGALAHAVDRLAGTGRVLYVAAHPDDENTRLLAYLANARHMKAAYLSMTRGGGGQNLIGQEQDELLDVIRTEELLAARRLDGAVQRFTRMRDFGYSKTAKETLAAWDEEQALADVVFVVRAFQPDLIITRFNEQPPNHGHHTASAILARHAFSAAADPQRFPEQMALGVKPWQAARLLYNVANWRKEPPPPGAFSLDVGDYDARLGLSYGELSARSRSQHKSQGFGVPGERGESVENFVWLAGSRPEQEIWGGLDFSWQRLGGAAVGAGLRKAREALYRDAPERALPGLLEAHAALAALPSSPRVREARVSLERVIAAASGLFVRASADRPGAVPGGSVRVRVEVVLRRPADVGLRRLLFPDGSALDVGTKLTRQQKTEFTREVRIAADAPISAPYFLAAAGDPAAPTRQVVRDRRLVGDPQGPMPLSVRAEFEFAGKLIPIDAGVIYAWTDRVHGERMRRFSIVPPATITPARKAVMFPNGKRTPVLLQVRAGGDAVSGSVRLQLPAGWRAAPESVPVSLGQAGDETTVRIEVTPPPNAAAVEVHPAIEVAGKSWSYREDVIDYPHIPMQVVLQPLTLRLCPVALELPKRRIGYVAGSGDTIAGDLAHVGFKVDMIDDETLRSADLSRWGAVILGIRAFNTRPALHAAQPRLMRYVENGGRLLVQYNTQSMLAPLTELIGPYPLTIGRDRVTDETAEMVAVDPKHPVLRAPNRLGRADFAGWVQERGLYFADKWDARYQPVFKLADPDEAPLSGSVLVARHGRGHYVYTGLAFFRQLPAGVPGAYRLLANLIAQ